MSSLLLGSLPADIFVQMTSTLSHLSKMYSKTSPVLTGQVFRKLRSKPKGRNDPTTKEGAAISSDRERMANESDRYRNQFVFFLFLSDPKMFVYFQTCLIHHVIIFFIVYLFIIYNNLSDMFMDILSTMFRYPWNIPQTIMDYATNNHGTHHKQSRNTPQTIMEQAANGHIIYHKQA